MNIKVIIIFISIFFKYISILNAQNYDYLVKNKEPLPILTGVVKDSVDNSVIPYAVVTLINKANIVLLKSDCDSEGVFRVQVVNDVYALTIQRVGYKTKSFLISSIEKKDTIFYLSQKAIFLNEAIVRSNIPLIQDQGDKITYNSSEDVSNNGGDVTDLLRKVPMVTVDMNGNPSIKSNSNVKILINGKPLGPNSTSSLKQISAPLVSKIEVITNPSAKYEAEGTGGVINIITKSKISIGLNGIINSGVGNKGSHLISSLSYQGKNVGFSGNISNNWFYNKTYGQSTFDQVGKFDISPLIHQSYEGNYNGSFNNIQLNTNIEKKNNYIGIDIFYTKRALNSNLPTNSTFFYDQSTELNSYRDITSKNTSNYLNLSVDYTHKYNKPKQELNLILAYSGNFNLSSYNFVQNINKTVIKENNYNPNNSNEISIQGDFQTSTNNKKNMFEAGFRLTNRNLNSNYSTLQDSLNINLFEKNYARSGFFKYNQSIVAAYILDKILLNPKMHIKVGIRMENTNNSLSIESKDNSSVKQNYFNYFPSASFNWRLSASETIAATYSYRIQRPSISFLNPNSSQGDPGMITIGNPYLLPEYTSNFELSYGKFYKENYVKITPYFRTTNNLFSSFSYSSMGRVATTYQNVGNQKVLGINLWITYNVTKNLSITSNLDVAHSNIDSQKLQTFNTGVVTSANINTSYKFQNKWFVQFFGGFYSPKIRLQGHETTFSFSNISLKKEFNNGKTSLAFGVDNPFRNAFIWTIETSFNQYLYNDSSLIYNRGIRVMFNYKLGKGLSAVKKETESKIGEDLKKVDDFQQNENIKN